MTSEPTDAIPQRRTKPAAGCLECHGMTARWRGRNAKATAELHASETGHVIWLDEIEMPEPKPAPAQKRKERKHVPEPISKGRLDKKNMCDGKVAHRSPAAAEKGLKCLPYNREFLNWYHCLYCGKYHIGHIIRPTSGKEQRV